MKHTENSPSDPDRSNANGPSHSAFLITLNLIIFFYTNLMIRLMLSPLFLTIQQDLEISKTATGQFFLFMALGFFTTMLLSSIPASRLGHRMTLIISSLCASSGALVIGLAGSIFIIKGGFLLVGIGSGLYLPSGVATITEAYGREKAPARIALHEMAPNIAFITLPLIVNGLLLLVTWREMFLLTGTLHLCMGIFFIFTSRGIHYRGKRLDLTFVRSLFNQKKFWVITFYFIIFYGSTLGFFSILPTFLVSEKGMSLGEANSITGLTRIAVLPALLAVGWVIRRISSGGFITIVFSFGGIFMAISGLANQGILVISLLLQPALLATFPPLGYLILDSFSPPGTRVQSSMISIIIPFAFLFGNGVFPSVLTWLADRGFFSQGIIVYGLFLAVSPVVYFLVLGRNEQKGSPSSL